MHCNHLVGLQGGGGGTAGGGVGVGGGGGYPVSTNPVRRHHLIGSRLLRSTCRPRPKSGRDRGYLTGCH